MRSPKALRIFLATFLALALVSSGVAIDVVWNYGAEDVCREKAPSGTTGYSITWQWDQLAYVCDYDGAAERRVGFTEAVRQ